MLLNIIRESQHLKRACPFMLVGLLSCSKASSILTGSEKDASDQRSQSTVISIPSDSNGNKAPDGKPSISPSESASSSNPTPEPPSGQCIPKSFPAKKYDVDIGTSANPICVIGSHPACDFLQSKFAIGQAAGNVGDLYQNVDDNHARVGIEKFPQVIELPRISPSSYHKGVVQDGVTPLVPHNLFDFDKWQYLGRPVLMNGSFVLQNNSGTFAYPRHQYHRGKRDSYLGTVWGYERTIIPWFENNAHIWHPEHLDHDANNNFYTTIPAVGISQGSSGSELDELEHQFAILAAFRPDVKKWLRERGLLIQAMLMIHRWGRVSSDSEYLSGSAHPVAMADVDPSASVRMVQKANDITMDRLPPFARISVVSETFSSSQNGSEIIMDTPYGIARMYRQPISEHSMVVSAETSFDVNCNPMSYYWKVLAGEFDSQGNRLVTIEQVNNGSWKTVRIKVKPGQFPAAGSPSTTSKLIHIGLFVDNGSFISLPAFVTISSDPSLLPN